MANTYLTRTVSSSSNRRTWTWSGWIKRGAITGNQSLFTSRSDGSNYSTIRLEPDRFHIFDLVSSSFNYQVKTNRKLRDVNGWYHLVVAFDTTQSTASNRVKLYVNGEQETSLAESSYPAQDYEGFINRNRDHYIGQGGNNGDNFDGIMSHINFVDGAALTPSSFGETDSTTGEWKIKTAPNVTYGTEGFFILKDGNSVTDQSGNGNNWTVGGGTLTNTQDNPSNIFCTLNPLAVGSSAPTFSKGNNRVVANATSYQFSCGTIAVPLTGKWYWEVKANDNVNGSSTEYLIGAVLESRLQASSNYGEFAADGITQYGSVGTGIGQNDIIGVSVDRTAATLKIYKNNSLIVTKTSLPAELIYPMVTVYGSVGADANFGNGYFGGTAISSAGTNASNNGIFEYDVIPSDANALSTKGLNL